MDDEAGLGEGIKTVEHPMQLAEIQPRFQLAGSWIIDSYNGFKQRAALLEEDQVPVEVPTDPVEAMFVELYTNHTSPQEERNIVLRKISDYEGLWDSLKKGKPGRVERYVLETLNLLEGPSNFNDSSDPGHKEKVKEKVAEGIRMINVLMSINPDRKIERVVSGLKNSWLDRFTHGVDSASDYT